MAGDTDVPDGLESRLLWQMEVQYHVRTARLEPRDALPERFLRILGADALEQSDDLLRPAPTRRGQPNLRRRLVEHVEVAHDGLFFFDARITRESRPAKLEQVAKVA